MNDATKGWKTALTWFVLIILALVIILIAKRKIESLPTQSSSITRVDTSRLRWWYVEESTPEEGRPSETFTVYAKDVIASRAAVVFSVSSVNNRGERVSVFFQYMPAQCGQGRYRSSDGRREGLFAVSSVSEGIVRGWYKGTKVPPSLPSGGTITLVREDLGRARGYNPPR